MENSFFFFIKYITGNQGALFSILTKRERNRQAVITEGESLGVTWYKRKTRRRRRKKVLFVRISRETTPKHRNPHYITLLRA